MALSDAEKQRREKRCGSGKKTKICRQRKSKIQTRSCDWKEKKYSTDVRETRAYHEEKMETKARPERENRCLKI